MMAANSIEITKMREESVTFKKLHNYRSVPEIDTLYKPYFHCENCLIPYISTMYKSYFLHIVYFVWCGKKNAENVKIHQCFVLKFVTQLVFYCMPNYTRIFIQVFIIRNHQQMYKFELNVFKIRHLSLSTIWQKIMGIQR